MQCLADGANCGKVDKRGNELVTAAKKWTRRLADCFIPETVSCHRYSQSSVVCSRGTDQVILHDNDGDNKVDDARASMTNHNVLGAIGTGSFPFKLLEGAQRMFDKGMESKKVDKKPDAKPRKAE